MPDTDKTVDEIVDESVEAANALKGDAEEGKENETGTLSSAGLADNPEFQALARESGWRPKEEFKGDPDKWVNALEYIKRSEDKSEKRYNQNRNLKKSMQAITKATQLQLKKMKEEHNKELQTLIAERDEAVKDGDVDRFKELEKDIENHKKDAPEDPEKITQDEKTAAYNDFKERNAWYGGKDDESKKLTILANGIGAELQSEDFDPEEFFEEIEKRMEPYVKRLKTAKNETTKTKGGSPVADGDKSKRSSGKTLSYADLTPEEKKILDELKESINDFDEKQYLKDVAEVRSSGNGRMYSTAKR